MSFPRFLPLLLGLALLVFAGGCASSKKSDGPLVVARFMLEAGEGEASATVRLPKSGTIIAIAPKTQFSEYDIQSCQVVDNELGKSLVFQLTEQASKDLYRLTATNQGKRIVTFLNGTALGATRLDRPLGSGYIITYIEVDDAELEELSKDIARTSADARKEIAKKTG